ncbi:MAG: SPOR domain-containing protein [Candidatus Omnitrophota bacterium]
MKGRQLQFFAADDDVNGRRKTIILPLDTFILLCIVVVLLFIVAFSLGVEKGRKISYAAAEKKERIFSGSVPPDSGSTLQVLQSDIPTQTVPRPVTSSGSAPIKKEEPTVRVSEKKTQVAGSRYVVQVATYYQENFAQEEVRKIKAKGVPAFLSKKNNFIAVFAGYFNSKEEAEKSMVVLKKTYRDCILRRF